MIRIFLVSLLAEPFDANIFATTRKRVEAKAGIGRLHIGHNRVHPLLRARLAASIKIKMFSCNNNIKKNHETKNKHKINLKQKQKHETQHKK
jgi:hypothetical protein